MSLRDRLRESKQAGGKRRLYDRFGILENPFPASNQNTQNPHAPLAMDKEAENHIFSFLENGRSQVLVVLGTQGVGKTNFLHHCETEIRGVQRDLEGYYVVRYLADPEASFEGTTRRLLEELGTEHLKRLADALHSWSSPIGEARSHDMRSALRKLAKSSEDVVGAMMDWLLGHRLLNAHRSSLGVQFRLDTVESKIAALRDLVHVSGKAGVLSGIFLLLDEIEKQDGVLGPRAVVRYLSSLRAIVDAMPRRLFMMIATTPDALERYTYALPALRSRLEDTIELSPLSDIDDAVQLARFYVEFERQRSSRIESNEGGDERIVRKREIESIYRDLETQAKKIGDEGVRQREFLHRLHGLAEEEIRELVRQV